jgi:hypothetical protein
MTLGVLDVLTVIAWLTDSRQAADTRKVGAGKYAIIGVAIGTVAGGSPGCRVDLHAAVGAAIGRLAQNTVAPGGGYRPGSACSPGPS